MIFGFAKGAWRAFQLFKIAGLGIGLLAMSFTVSGIMRTCQVGVANGIEADHLANALKEQENIQVEVEKLAMNRQQELVDTINKLNKVKSERDEVISRIRARAQGGGQCPADCTLQW